MMDPTARRRAGGRQTGATLLGLLLYVVLAAVLIAPLAMWGSFALRQQPQQQAGLLRVAGTSLLHQYFPRDVSVAGAAANTAEVVDAVEATWNFEDCVGGAAASDIVLVLLRGGPEPSKIVYTETASAQNPGVGTLWRRECEAQTGTDTDEVELIGRVVRSSTTAECGLPEGTVHCRHVTFRTTPVASGEEITLSSSRRVDSVAVEHLVSDNRVPIAKIELLSQAVAPDPQYAVVLSSEHSRDPDGDIVCYQWVFPTVAWGASPPAEPERVTIEVPPEPVEGAPEPSPDMSWCPENAAEPIQLADREDPTFHVHERQVPTAGRYYVELTVTDDKGHSTTTYKRIEIVQPDPVADARARIVAGGGQPGDSVVELAARWIDPDTGEETGAYHPDGTITSYEWVLVAGHGGPESAFIVQRDTPDPVYVALPPWMQGLVTVRLTVTDDRGRTAEMSQAVELMWDPPQPPELPPEGWPAPVRPADPPLPSGSHTAPSMPSLTTRSDGDGAQWPVVEWTGPAEVERYRIEFRHRGSGGCDIRHARVIDAVENPQHVLYPSLCPLTATPWSEVRIGAEYGEGIGWSGWLTYPAPAFRTDPLILDPDEEGG